MRRLWEDGIEAERTEEEPCGGVEFRLLKLGAGEEVERAKLCNLGCLLLGNQGSTPKAISPLAPQSISLPPGPQSSSLPSFCPHPRPGLHLWAVQAWLSG